MRKNCYDKQAAKWKVPPVKAQCSNKAANQVCHTKQTAAMPNLPKPCQRLEAESCTPTEMPHNKTATKLRKINFRNVGAEAGMKNMKRNPRLMTESRINVTVKSCYDKQAAKWKGPPVKAQCGTKAAEQVRYDQQTAAVPNLPKPCQRLDAESCKQTERRHDKTAKQHKANFQDVGAEAGIENKKRRSRFMTESRIGATGKSCYDKQAVKRKGPPVKAQCGTKAAEQLCYNKPTAAKPNPPKPCQRLEAERCMRTERHHHKTAKHRKANFRDVGGETGMETGHPRCMTESRIRATGTSCYDKQTAKWKVPPVKAQCSNKAENQVLYDKQTAAMPNPSKPARDSKLRAARKQEGTMTKQQQSCARSIFEMSVPKLAWKQSTQDS